MEYKRRIIDDLLDELMPALPAILLDGPKAVGKTTTALQRAKKIINLDLHADRQLIEASSDWAESMPKPLLLDEWQKSPEVWNLVKRSVDKNFAGGQFLLTGSMPVAATHSGAGRITSLRMRPLSLFERNLEISTVKLSGLLSGNAEIQGETKFGFNEYCKELIQSGFPALRNLEGNALIRALDGYIERIIDSELPEIGVNIRQPATLKGWLTAYAAATGTNASWETIRDAASPGLNSTPAKSTTIPYRDSLTALRILDELPAWLPTRNKFVQAGQSAKHYLADPSLAMHLMNLDLRSIQSVEQFGATKFDAPLLGRLFEALAVLSLRIYADANNAKVMHFRDKNGRHEVDLILERTDGKILALEVKLGSSVNDSDIKHLKWLKQQLGEELIDMVLVYSGSYAFRYEGVAIVPLALLGP